MADEILWIFKKIRCFWLVSRTYVYHYHSQINASLSIGYFCDSQTIRFMYLCFPWAIGYHMQIALFKQSPVDSPHKGQWRGACFVFFDVRLNKRLCKYRDAGDFRHNRAHHSATVMDNNKAVFHCECVSFNCNVYSSCKMFHSLNQDIK